MQIFGTNESVYVRKEFNSYGIGLEHQHGRRFIVLEHQYGRCGVKTPIVLPYSRLPELILVSDQLQLRPL